MLKRCEDTKLALNWEKSHFMVKEGIVLGHKISRKGIEVDKAKVDVISKLPPKTSMEFENQITTTEKEMLVVVYAFEKFPIISNQKQGVLFIRTLRFEIPYQQERRQSKIASMVLLLQENLILSVIDTKELKTMPAITLSSLENLTKILLIKEITRLFL
ncbi:hypothetical protein Tco_0553077 [Tanacetum coccineum]